MERLKDIGSLKEQRIKENALNRVVIQRHGHSTYNSACLDLNYLNNPDADPDLIDAPLSEQGLAECEKASAEAMKEVPGLSVVFVSPLMRAM